MAAALASTALSAMRGAFQAASVATSTAKRPASGKGGTLSQAMNRGIAEAHKELGKSNPAMSKALSAMSGAVPHLSAMTQGKGLGSTLLSGFKAARELRKATRELSKMGGPSATDSKAGGKAPVLSFRVGEIQTNFGSARGFRDMGGRKGKDGQPPAKNYGISIRIGPGNHDQAKDGGGFRELGGRNGQSAGKGGAGAKRSPSFQIIIGHQPKGRGRSGEGASRGGGGAFGAQIHISFARGGGASSEMAAIRVGGLSISTHGASAASHSRKRANAFDGRRTQRKHASGGEAFPSLGSHTGSKARHRATPASTGRHEPGFAMTIAFSGRGMSQPMSQKGSAANGRRARAKTF